VNKSFLSIACGLVLSTGATQLYAEVISNNIATDIIEPAGTYDISAPNVLNMTATTVIEAGPCIPSNYTGCTLNDILNDINPSDDFKPEIKVHMTADDFPDDGLVSNATMRQRGATSRSAPQKSFRIKLDSKKHLWRGERRIQLIKSMYDFTRVRNKLAYDLFAEIPHLPSMRSQFVHLNINNQAINEDYGLYTSVEHFGKEYLVRRGWDKDSRVYKAESFDFYAKADLEIDATTGKPKDKVAFEKLVEIKRGKTHFDFANMIKDLNNPAVDFNTQIMGKYFNLDNYLTWFAVNILVGNADTNFHNFYLYNPKGKDNFYLIPWDYDISFGMNLDDPNEPFEQLPRWWTSQANWWDILLHRRFLSEPGNLALLKTAILEVKNKYLTEAKIKAKADSYYDIVFPILRQTPDWDYIYVQGNTDPERVAEYNRIFTGLAKNVETNYQRFLERVDDPMPFYMDKAQFLSNHQIKFSWTPAVSLNNQAIVYEIEIATTADFKAGTIISKIPNISTTEHTLTWTHPKGQYFFRVRARDAANPQLHWQEATNDDDGLKYASGVEIYGVRKMYVAEDGGTVTPPTVSVSNPVASITVDGDSSDWSALTLFGNDGNDIPDGNKNIIDWKSATFAHNNQTVYLLYKNYGNIGNRLEWGWQVFIDTDNNPTTGFKYSDNLGADYIIEGAHLLKYNGSGTNWNWKSKRTLFHKIKENTVEFGLPRSWLGNPASFKVAFQGANESYGGTSVDNYPNNTKESFSYSFGKIMPPSNQAPIASNQNISVTENTQANFRLQATDANNDLLNVIITQQPTHGTLTLATDSAFVSYKPNASYTGADSFKYKVSDGQLESNIATVSLNISAKPSPNSVSNLVNAAAIRVDGNSNDWKKLKFFNNDPKDIASNAKNPIDWEQAALAHSNDTVYLIYKNHNQVNPNANTGSEIKWGWQTFIDTDKKANTGFRLNSDLGAEYLVEGKTIFQYKGNGNNWKWVKLGTADLKYSNKTIELSFPRNWLSQHSNVKVAFFGNNEAYSGRSYDRYPNKGSFEYSFTGTAETANTLIPVAATQKSVFSSPETHKPPLASTTDTVNSNDNKKSGGSFSWTLLAGMLLFINRRRLLKAK